MFAGIALSFLPETLVLGCLVALALKRLFVPSRRRQPTSLEETAQLRIAIVKCKHEHLKGGWKCKERQPDHEEIIRSAPDEAQDLDRSLKDEAPVLHGSSLWLPHPPPPAAAGGGAVARAKRS